MNTIKNLSYYYYFFFKYHERNGREFSLLHFSFPSSCIFLPIIWDTVQAGSGIIMYNFLRIHISRTAGLFSAYYISFFIIFKINNRTEAGFLIRLIFQDFASFSKAFKSISRAPPCEKNKNQSSGSQMS